MTWEQLISPHVHVSNIVLALFFVASVSIVFYQQNQINNLTSSQSTLTRNRRSSSPSGDHSSFGTPIEYFVGTPEPGSFEEIRHATSDSLLYLPMFTQISHKSLEKACLEMFGTRFKHNKQSEERVSKDQLEEQGEKPNDTKLYDKKIREKLDYKIKKSQKLKKYRQKYCAPITSLGPAKLLSERLYKNGSAIRYGRNWFLTEYQMGYMLFEFELNDQSLEKIGKDEEFLNYPLNVHTLPEPYMGTDHTISGDENNIVFYYSTPSKGEIHALNLQSGHLERRLLPVSEKSVYEELDNEKGGRKMSSYIDLERDHTALWAIYRRQNSSFLSVEKMSPKNLKGYKIWELSEEIVSSGLVNAFVSCGILYTVHNEPPSESYENYNQAASFLLYVVATYDFRTNSVINQETGKRFVGEMPTIGHGRVSNVQYDLKSDSLTYFDNGKIFSVAIQRSNA